MTLTKIVLFSFTTTDPINPDVNFTVSSKTSRGGVGLIGHGRIGNAILAAESLVFLMDSALHGGTVGKAYSTTVHAAGGTTPYRYSITSGSLPDGLSLDTSTGVISGIPTAAGAATFTIQAADSTAHAASQSFTITIAEPASGGGNWGFVA